MEVPDPLSKGITVYSKTGCSFCDKLKGVLYDDETFPFEEVKANMKKDAIPFRIYMCDSYLEADKAGFLEKIEVLAKKSYTTFPMVFWDGEFVGGYKETISRIQKTVAPN